MKKLSFFQVLKGNIKCAVCKEKNCKIRYFPNRQKEEMISGCHGLHVRKIYCPKLEVERRKRDLKRRLP